MKTHESLTAPIEAAVLAPLRARGVLSDYGAQIATPARVVEMTLERLDSQAKEIERLKAVNAGLVAKTASAPGSGLRKRMKAAQEAQALAEANCESAERMRRLAIDNLRVERRDLNALASVVAVVIGERIDTPVHALATRLKSKWEHLTLNEVTRRADTLATAISDALAAYARTSL